MRRAARAGSARLEPPKDAPVPQASQDLQPHLPIERADELSTHRYYDRIAQRYHRSVADWSGAVGRQGQILDRFIREQMGDAGWAVLDCSCGIGTQAIGLAERGHRVHGTDVSEAALERAREEAATRGADVSFSKADLRCLDDAVGGIFDVVLSCDNSLPHLLTAPDLQRAVEGMRERLRPGGLFLASIRDYDRHLLARPGGTAPVVVRDPTVSRLTFQTWTWGHSDTYTSRLFLLEESEQGWHTESFDGAVYRAIRRDELTDVLLSAGFADVRWRMPDQSGYHQPLVSAHAPLAGKNLVVVRRP